MRAGRDESLEEVDQDAGPRQDTKEVGDEEVKGFVPAKHPKSYADHAPCTPPAGGHLHI